MKAWLTARELATEALPGLPDTERGVQLLAEREGWADSLAYVRKRAGRGGGLEYNIALLPPLARIEYERRHRKIAAEAPAEAPQIVLGTDLSGRAARERDARLAIVQAYEAFGRGMRLTEASKAKIFVDSYNADRLEIDPWIKEIITQISVRTLARWRAARAEGRADKLAVDRAAARKGKGVLETANNGQAKHFVLALMAYQPHIKAERVMTLLSDEFGQQLVDGDGEVHPIPPVRTIQHWMKIWRKKEVVALTQLSDPDRYRSAYAPSGVGMLRHIRAANQLWMIDSSPLDAFDDEISRPTAYACIDVGTRRKIIYLSRSPKAAAVALLLRKSLLAWGVPQAIKTDNGSDFIAEDTRRLVAALDIQLELSTPYAPAEKAHVERAIKTMQHGLVELLPGYIGHNVAERKRLEDRKSFAKRLGAETAELFGVRYTLAEIQEVADRWVDVVYHQTAHDGLGGKTPAQVAAEDTTIVRTIDERALDVLLMPVPKGGYRTVTKRGVQIGEFYYFTIRALPGDRVFVRQDPNDLGLVYLFDADSGSYVELGVCPELRGIDPADHVKFVKKQRAALLAEKTAPIRKEVRELTRDRTLAERYLDEKARQLSMRDNVIQLPRHTTEHVTPEIAAALTAATGEHHPAPIQPTLEVPAEPATVLAFQPRPAAAGGRPAFRTDQEMAAWLLANPQAVTARDRALMAERLRSWTFRELLAVHGVDADALAALTKLEAQTS
jgi:transposase InsO family protein